MRNSYICSRIFLHDPPGEDNALGLAKHQDAPEEFKLREKLLEEGDPEVDVLPCIIMLIMTVAIMATTAEWVGPCTCRESEPDYP
jgi:Ca2+:H+ antiporter